MGKSAQFGVMDWVSFGMSFVLVVAIVAGLYWLMQRVGSGQLSRRRIPSLGVVESLTLGTRQRVVLMRIRDREVLLGLTPSQINLLSSWPAVEPEICDEAGRAAAAPAPWGLFGKRGAAAGKATERS